MDATFYKNRMYGGGGAVRGNFYYPIIYSTEEREVGVGENDKPLYQKTIESDSISADSVVTTGLTNIESYHVIAIEMISISNNAEFSPNSISMYNYQGAGTNYGTIYFNNNELQFVNNSRVNAIKIRAVIQYTKTTDVAGSGQYTTLGILAVHYSTDEQVIGTWLGETLYQKIVSFDNVTINANGFASYQLSQYINNLSHAIFHKTVAIITGGYSELPSVHVGEISGYAWSSALNNNELYISRGNASGVTADYKVVVEYTKST